MASIRPLNVHGTDNTISLEESNRIVENTSQIREHEVILLQEQVFSLEGEMKKLKQEYVDFLETNNLIDEDIDAESVVPYSDLSDLGAPPNFNSYDYVDNSEVISPNPTYFPLSIALNEADELLGPLVKKLDWYQNEIKKKYMIRMIKLKRIEDIESRENSIED